jgi:hypothetical protein
MSVFDLFNDTPSSDVDLGVEHHHDDERQVEDVTSALYLFDDAPCCDAYLGVEHHHSDDRHQWGQCILFSLISTPPPPPPPPQQCLAPTCYLSTFNLHCIAGAGLPIHIIGEVLWEPKR